MMRRSACVLSLCLALCGTALWGQDQPTGFHRVACYKVNDGKLPEYLQLEPVAGKIMQAVADSGKAAAWYRLRSIFPSGSDARCDYVAVTLYSGAPPEPLGRDALAAALQKANVGMDVDTFLAKRDSATRLVSSELWQTTLATGQMQKGDYLYVNWMKTHNTDDWLKVEKEIWFPMADTWVKEARIRAWFVNLPVLPNGTERPYQGVSVDVFPSWEAAIQGPPIADTFAKVHSGKDINQVFQDIGKARDLALREMYKVEDKVIASGK